MRPSQLTTYRLPPTVSPRAKHMGFTLIETLIVIAITAMLSAIAITYSSVSRNQVSLSVEASKVSEVVLQARALAIATYGDTTDVCGYGVSFDPSAETYSLFAYHPSGDITCPSVSTIKAIAPGDMQVYTQGTSNIHVANGVTMSAGTGNDGIAYILFYPPEPQTFIARFEDNGQFTNQAANIYLATVDGTASTTIMVNTGGQVSF